MKSIVLRDVQPSDLEILFEHQYDPQAWRMAAFPPRERDAFMAHWANILRNETGMTKAVVLEGKVVGYVVSFDLEGRRLLGYWFGKEHWGKGIASVAVARFLAIERTRPLHALVAKHNLASIRILEKCGFVVAGKGQFIGPEGAEIEEFVMVLGTVH